MGVLEHLSTNNPSAPLLGRFISVGGQNGQMSSASFLSGLRSELDELAARNRDILEQSEIRHFNWNDSSSEIVVAGFPPHGWAPTSAAVSAQQMAMLRDWDHWVQRFRLLFPHPTTQIAQRISEATTSVRRWLERDGSSDWAIPATVPEAKTVAGEWFADLEALLDLLQAGSESGCFVIPDTNALILNPDLATYSRAVGRPDFTVVLIPTVMGELDKLKDRGNADLKRKAQGVIRRFKGLRDRGELRNGVKLTQGITVMTIAKEVNPSLVLDWLDPAVMDDRILAAALAFQSEHAESKVVLATSDLNLQNKADAVSLP